MFSAILILLAMPFTDLSRSRGIQFRPLSKIAFFIFLANFLILMILGAKHVESPFIEFGQISTVLYFAHYLIIVPLLSLIENSLIELGSFNYIKKVSNEINSLRIFNKLSNSTILQNATPFSLFLDSIKRIIIPFMTYRNILFLLIIIRLSITTYLMVKHIYYDIDTSSILFQPMFITDNDKMQIAEIEESIKSDISRQKECLKEFNEEFLKEAFKSKSTGEYFLDSEQGKITSLESQRDASFREGVSLGKKIQEHVKDIQKLDPDYVLDRDELSKK